MPSRVQIVSFLTLHILNLCTTLTPATALARYNGGRDATVASAGAPTVDITSAPVAEVLDQLNGSGSELDMLVKVHPPVYVEIDAKAGGAPNLAYGVPPAAVDSWATGISTWIALLLALSVMLNGYLIKGLGFASALSGPPKAQGVRFEEEKVAPAPKRAPAPAPKAPAAPLLELDAIDEKLKAAQDAQARAEAKLRKLREAHSAGPATPAADRTFALFSPAGARDGAPRSLEECIDVYENGPRPLSAALATLNDEEIIQLAQAGKIQAYALEKVLADNERAVYIRRALVCEYHHYSLI
jgi:hydroxymethylglutaryl-CoA reductase (NADPH)